MCGKLFGCIQTGTIAVNGPGSFDIEVEVGDVWEVELSTSL